MYAPVIIPTLNRIKHLKRCIESIALNKEAIYTDIFISVDYPPSDKYKSGYNEVKEYVKTIIGFRQVHVFIQDENLGPGRNNQFLVEQISKDYDCYIISEDDNEFSNSFLKYINWGLQKFRDDKSIIAVCSTSDFPVIVSNQKADYMKLEAYNGYGAGHWLYKEKDCLKYLKEKRVDEIYRSKQTRKKIYSYSPMLYYWIAMDSLRKISVMRNREDGLTNIDIWRNVYCIEKDVKCIIPIIPKSRNWGNDGTGIHSSSDESPNYVPKVEFKKDANWKSNPVCLSAAETYENLVSHSVKYKISLLQKVESVMLIKINAILGNKLVLSIYNKIKCIYRSFAHEKKNESEEFWYV